MEPLKNPSRAITTVLLLLIASKLYSQAQPPCFSLKLDVQSNPKADSNFVLEVDLTNTAKERIGIGLCLGNSVECNFAVDVRDNLGNLAYDPQFLTSVATEGAFMSIEPGQTVKFISNLQRLYDVLPPGTYTVQVRRSGTNAYIDSHCNQAVVESNIVTFTVAPNPQMGPTRPYSLWLSVSPKKAEVGSDFLLRVYLTNNTNKPITVEICGHGIYNHGVHMGEECSFDVDVRDNKGNSAPETAYLKTVRTAGTGFPTIAVQSIGNTHIQPHQEIEFAQIDLRKLYDLSQPGNYTVQVSTTYYDAVVESRKDWFVVEPNPQTTGAKADSADRK